MSERVFFSFSFSLSLSLLSGQRARFGVRFVVVIRSFVRRRRRRRHSFVRSSLFVV